MDRNEWAWRILQGVGEDFFGKIEVEFRRGQVHKVTRQETHVPPEQEAAYRKSLQGAKPLKPDSPESP